MKGLPYTKSWRSTFLQFIFQSGIGCTFRIKSHAFLSLFVKQIKVLQLSAPQDFETALFNIIYGFEQTASSFKSLVHDPELSIYVTPPASDVVYALSRDLEEEEKAKKIPWPDAELLFGQDPDYQNDVGQIFHQIKDEVENVLSYSRVSNFRRNRGKQALIFVG